MYAGCLEKTLRLKGVDQCRGCPGLYGMVDVTARFVIVRLKVPLGALGAPQSPSSALNVASSANGLCTTRIVILSDNSCNILEPEDAKAKGEVDDGDCCEE